MKKSIILVLVILIIDQTIKYFVKTNMSLGDSISIFGSWAYLHFVENEGMAFGWRLFGGGSFGKLFLTVFRLVAIIGIAYYLKIAIKEKKHKVFITSISLILAGAIGNLIDSILYGIIFSASGPYTIASIFPKEGGYSPFLHGKVVDMFYFPILEGNYPHWIPFIGGDYYQFFQPIFNVADASISIGVVILIIMQKSIFGNKPAEENIEEKNQKEVETLEDN